MSKKIKVKKAKKRVVKIKARKLAQAGRKKLGRKALSEFKKIISKRKEEVSEEIKHISDDTLKKSQKESSGDISGYTYHMADVATDNYDREFSLGLASNDRQALYELDDATKRIEDGTFGICEDCNSIISKVRLKAVPQARLCIKCQERREKR